MMNCFQSPVPGGYANSTLESTLDRNIILDSDDEDAILPSTQPVDQRILKNVVVYVEVRSNTENRSKAVQHELELLGASISKKFGPEVTHVVYKDGKKSTRDKAIKKGIFLVSVLWVDSCKQNQEHVSERLFPVHVPKDDGTPILIARLRKVKSMQPNDFDDEVANSSDKGEKKRRRNALAEKWRTLPAGNSPSINRVLALETQQMSPFMVSPSFSPNLTIPDTPSSMKKALESLRKKKELEAAERKESPVSSQRSGAPSKKLFDNDTANTSVGITRDSWKLGSESISIEAELIKPPGEGQGEVQSSSDLQKGETILLKNNIKPVKKSKRKLLSPCEEPTSFLLEPTRSSQDDSTNDDSASGKHLHKNKNKRKRSPSHQNDDLKNKRQRSEIDTNEFPIPLKEAVGNVETAKKSIFKGKGRRSCAFGKQKRSDPTKNSTSDEKMEFETNELRWDVSNLPAISNSSSSSANIVNSVKSDELNTDAKKCSHRRSHAFGDHESPSSLNVDASVKNSHGTSETEAAPTRRKSRRLSCMPALKDCQEAELVFTATESVVPQDFDFFKTETKKIFKSTAQKQNTSTFSELADRRKSVDEFRANTGLNYRKQKRLDKSSVGGSVKSMTTESSCTTDFSSGENSTLSDSKINGATDIPEGVHQQQKSKKKCVQFLSSSNSSKKPKATIVMTSVHYSEQDIVISIVKKLGGFTISDAVSDQTTHVVCGSTRRTLNVLHAITRGCWLLSLEWVLKSLESGEWLPEEPYEMERDFPAVKMARQMRAMVNSGCCVLDLFSDVGPVFVSEKSVPPREALVELIKACGGTVTRCLRKSVLCIGTVSKSEEQAIVKELWLLDSITAFRKLEIEDYLLQSQPRAERESSPAF